MILIILINFLFLPPLCYAFLLVYNYQSNRHNKFAKHLNVPRRLRNHPNHHPHYMYDPSLLSFDPKSSYLNLANFTKSLAQFKNLEDATCVFESMERIYAYFDNNDEHIIMTWKKERQIIKIDPLGVDMYNTLLRTYARSRDDAVALLAESVLYRMQTIQSSSSLTSSSSRVNIRPTITSYNYVLECWSNYCGHDRTTRAEELLDYLENNLDDVTIDSYNSLILAYLRSSKEKQPLKYTQKAQNLLDRIEEQFFLSLNSQPDSSEGSIPTNPSIKNCVKPDVLSYTVVISCWANVSQQMTSLISGIQNKVLSPYKNSLMLLKRMEILGVSPNVRTYSGILQCLAFDTRYIRSSTTFIKQLRPILQSMKSNEVKPNVIVYAVILNTLSKCGTPEQCEQFLKMMAKNSIDPNAFCFASIINSYTGSNLPPKEIVRNALRLFKMCDEEYRNSIVYTAVINALTRLSPYDKDSAVKAASLHNSMISVYNKTKLVDYRPTTLSFSAVINCWAKSSAEDRVEKALLVYNDLLSWSLSNNDPNLQISTVPHNALLDAMARTANKYNDLAWQCHQKLQNMYLPDQRSYGAVIYAYANTKTFDGALNATSMLKTMVANRVEPNAVAYTTAINALSKSYKSSLKNEILNITNELFTSIDWDKDGINNSIPLCTVLLDVFGKCGDIDRVQKLYESMFENKESGTIRPTPTTHHIIISSYLLNKKPILAHRHADLNQSFISTKTWNLLMKYCSKANDMSQLEHIFYHRISNPNVISYTTYIHALSKLRSEESARKAEEIFMQMNESSPSSSAVQPNLYTYNALLNAWCKSKSPHASNKCQQLLSKMKAHGIVPDVISYTCYMGALSDVGDVRACMTLIERMIRVHSLIPDRRMIDVVLQTIHRSKDLSHSNKEDEKTKLMEMVK